MSLVTGALFALGFSVALAVPAGAAGDGYTPTPTPTPTPVPSGCPAGTVVSSLTVTSAGGTVSGVVDGVNVTVTVPPGAFPSGAQVAILDTSSIAIAPTGDTIVLALGINFCVNGTKYTGTFSPPATVTLTNPNIKPGQTLYQQIGSTLVPVSGVTISNGSLTFTIDSDPDFVLVTAPATTSVIPGATSVVTGKPFLLEGIVAGVLALVGALMLFLRLRLRHR